MLKKRFENGYCISNNSALRFCCAFELLYLSHIQLLCTYLSLERWKESENIYRFFCDSNYWSIKTSWVIQYEYVLKLQRTVEPKIFIRAKIKSNGLTHFYIQLPNRCCSTSVCPRQLHPLTVPALSHSQMSLRPWESFIHKHWLLQTTRLGRGPSFCSACIIHAYLTRAISGLHGTWHFAPPE